MAIWVPCDLPKVHAADCLTIDVKRPGNYLCEITGDVAYEWLERYNTDNRDYNHLRTQHLVHLWRSDQIVHAHPAPVVFDTRGVLSDAQHRLRATFESGVTWWARVITGSPPAARDHIDTGLPRALRDRLVLVNNHKENTTACQLVREIAAIHLHHRTIVSPDMCRQLFGMVEEGIRFAASIRRQSDRGIGRAGVWLAIAEGFYLDAARVREFAEDLKVVGGRVQQAQYLRDSLIREASHGAAARERVYGQTVAAICQHLRGKPIKALQVMGGWPEEYAGKVPKVAFKK
jgi:hypothetical protein